MSEEKPIKALKPRWPWQKAIALGLALLLLLGGGGAAWYFLWRTQPAVSTTVQRTAAVQRGTLTISATASGTTAKGVQTQTVNWSAGNAELVVETVYHAVGDTVAQGDDLLKLSDDSVIAVREELTSNVAAARSALAQAKIDHAADLIQARANYEASLAGQSAAGAVYNETITALSDAVNTAKTGLTEARTMISTYPAQITSLNKQIKTADSALKTDQAEVTTAQSDLQTAEKNWQQASESANKAQSEADQAQYMVDWTAAYLAEQENQDLVSSFSELQQAQQADLAIRKAQAAAARIALAAAQDPYDKARTHLQAAQKQVSADQEHLTTLNQTLQQKEQDLDQAQSSLATDEARYAQAVADQKIQTISASQTLAQSQLAGSNAQFNYDIAVQTADQILADARQAVTTAESVVTLFEQAIGDGTIGAAYAGTLSAVGYEAEDVLTAETAVAQFANTSVTTATVSVDQADIAGIAVGDAVQLSLSAGSRQPSAGKVTSIAMTATSAGVSTVKYAVTVTFAGEATAVSAGQTATASFVKDTLADVLYVSQAAIIEVAGAAYVDQQENGQVTRVPVTIGRTNGQYTVILSGLTEGDVYVVTQTAQQSAS